MIELRFCSIEGATWLDQLSALPAAEEVQSPWTGRGMFERALARRAKEKPLAGDLRASDAQGAVLGIVAAARFDANFAISVVFAVANAVPVGRIANRPEPEILEAFFGRAEGEALPDSLRAAGVTACLTGATAQELARWMREADEGVFVDEVVDMFGEKSVSDYVSLKNIICRVLESTSLHGCDVCILDRG